MSRPHPASTAPASHYRRAAEAPHRVVAQPFPRTSPTHPVLYDTSVSSATLTNSAEDLRSTGSGYHSSNHSPLYPAPSGWSPQQRARKQPTSFVPNHQEAPPYRSRLAQSEPGTPEQDRFAAYVNRFAELDPRMDHRSYSSACKNQVALEEKKLDDVLVAVIEQQEQLLLSKDRFRSRAAVQRSPAASQSRRLDHASIPQARSHDGPSTADLRTASSREEAASDFVLSSPSGRTRDLARRFEQRLAEKQPRPNDAGTASRTAPAAPYYPRQSQLAATYIPVSKPSLPAIQVEKAPSDERGEDVNVGATQSRLGGMTHDSDEKMLRTARSGSMNDNDVLLYRRSPQSYDTLHHSNMSSRVPSNPAECMTEDEAIPLDHCTERIVHPHSEPFYPHIDPVVKQSRRPEVEDAPRRRSASEGPPLRRRPRPVTLAAPPPPVEPAVQDVALQAVADESPSAEPVIRRLGHRAEIETPSPARVQELRKKLWTEDELLQVRVRSSYYDSEKVAGYHRTHASYGPEMAGSAGQRSARSLSPKTQRVRSNNVEVPPPPSVSNTREHQGMLFKSRYYEAALRGDAGMSSNPGSSNKDGRLDSKLQSKRSFESSSVKASLPSSKSSEMKDDVDTTQAVPSAETKTKATKSANKPRSARMRHLESLRETNNSMRDGAALSLIRRITLAQKDDPQAALSQIQALLREQQNESELDLVGDPEDTLPISGSSAGRDSTSLPAVQKAYPMEENNESDDESDGTSVSSMTNPTYQESHVKDSAVPFSSAGRPRPSFLGGYPSSPANQHLRSAHRKIPASQNDIAAAGTVGVKSALLSVDTMRNNNTERSNSNLESNLPTVSAVTVPTNQTKESKINDSAVKSKPSPSLFAQLGTMISPRRDDSRAHAEELVTKIQLWDEMSTGVIPGVDPSRKPGKLGVHPEDILSTGTTTALGSIITESGRSDLPISPGNELKRAHPWDASIPVRMGQVNVKDTSMDCGDGVEAQFTPKYSEAEISPASADEIPLKNVRKSRINREKPVTLEAPIVSERDDGGDGVISNVVSAPHMASEILHLDPRQQQQVKAMSDDFDSAWVSLPTSTYFGAKSTRTSVPRTSANMESCQPKESSPSIIRERLSTDEKTEYIPDGEVEVQYLRDTSHRRPPEMQIFSPEHGDALPSNPSYRALGPLRGSYARHRKSSAIDESHNSEQALHGRLNHNGSFESGMVQSLESTEKSRGRGLRGFLKRKQAERGKRDESLERDAMTASSMASTRWSNGNNTTVTQPLGEAADVEESNGNEAVKSSRYYRRSSKSRSPSRGRARSLDERRTRTPSLGRKFNRLLRVYDHDSDFHV